MEYKRHDVEEIEGIGRSRADAMRSLGLKATPDAKWPGVNTYLVFPDGGKNLFLTMFRLFVLSRKHIHC